MDPLPGCEWSFGKEWSWLTRKWRWFDVPWFGSCCPIQRVVGKDLENLRGSSKSSLGRYAVFQKSFGVRSFESQNSKFLVRSRVALERSA
jgi:hypothetical protein